VAGTSGTITKVVVRLNNMNHTFPGDYDILLVGPGGQSAIIMSDVGGGTDIIGVTLTLDDAAAANMTGAALVTGTFKPTNLVGVAPEPDTWPAPAPAPPAGGASALSAFNGTSANGAWNLWVFDGSDYHDERRLRNTHTITECQPGNTDADANTVSYTHTYSNSNSFC
jgi:subtilisin-like proprotein convertase family protein